MKPDFERALDAALLREEKLKAEVERLKEALRVIDRPRLKNAIFTSQEAQDKAHLEQMQEWIDKHYNTENHKLYVINFYGGATLIAEQALKQ